jgi:L-threonylcarbamoyladenylate synthase
MDTAPFETAEDLDLAVEKAWKVLAGNGVVLLPTETYYGLAGNPGSHEAIERIMVLKMRPATMPLPVLVGNWQQVEQLAEVPERFRVNLEASWPGPLTAVLHSRHPVVASPGPTIAVRIPGHSLLRALLERVGPVTGTSANRHGTPAPVTAKEALGSLNGAPDLVLDGGRTEGGGPSTVVSLTGERPRLLRSGKHDEIVDRFC